MRLSGIDALRRGLSNLRANWELVPLQWLGMLIVAALFVAGVIPVLIAFGFSLADLADAPPSDAAGLMAALEHFLATLAERAVPLALAGLAALALWTIGALVHCWFLAGTYGVLAAADRQAAPGVPRGWLWYRTFSWNDFRGWASRGALRYFWFFNLYIVLSMGVVLLATVLLVLAIGAAQAWGAVAGFGVGCGGALPLAFLLIVSVLWSQLGLAELGNGATVGGAARRGFAVLGRRLGAVVLLFLLSMAASVVLSSVFLPLSMMGSLFADSPWGSWVLQAPLTVLQWLASTIIQTVLAAALVALMRAEADVPSRARPVG